MAANVSTLACSQIWDFTCEEVDKPRTRVAVGLAMRENMLARFSVSAYGFQINICYRAPPDCDSNVL